MITSLSLSHFRKHVDQGVDFTPGLNVLRGSNEHGKTSILESALYALYGTKALRTSLEDTVTWGHKVNQLKVILGITISDVAYSFSRSKAGAEVTWQGGMVTGQAEVSKYAADLLGADAKTAALLMMASQDGLAGALGEGPGKVSELISKLADFALLDQVLDAAQTKLQLGSEEPLRVKLADTLTALEVLQNEAPPVDAAATLAAEWEAAEADSTRLVAMNEAVFQPGLDSAAAALGLAEAGNRSHEAARQNVVNLQTRLDAEQARLTAAETASAMPDEGPIAGLQQQIADAGQHQVLVDQKALLDALPPYPSTCWEGTHADMLAEMATAYAQAATHDSRIAGALGEIRGLEGSVLTQGKCPTCGQDVNGDAHIAERNADLQQRIAGLRLEISNLRTLADGYRDTAKQVADLDHLGKKWVEVATRLGPLVSVNASVYPPALSWAGGAVTGAVDVRPLQRQIKQVQDAVTAANQAAGRASAHRAAAVDLLQQVLAANAALAVLPAVDTDPLKGAHDEAYRAYLEHSTMMRNAAGRVSELLQQVNAWKVAAASHAERVKSAGTRVTELRTEIETVSYNNAFLKKVKALKPAISDHLWSLTLSAVSTFFSQMRGEQSIVTKDKDGFKVNGQAVDSLSGSTKDLLALAVRVALTRTFIPHATFITLDEPAHGCDTGRTGNLLGFLASCGMQQVILASHDDLSESVADNVIAVGA